ncbi:nitroreductase family protein [Streptomyces sp. V4-01]|uniref:Nitroreductase family protein n=1 Tax=Actinacidiphila polyblastidii TaxID=3110430 RepID=A0ABU7PK13_9ACTN|nr:nitroreductase family protein [Streptomyces sp. V4-01]
MQQGQRSGRPAASDVLDAGPEPGGFPAAGLPAGGTVLTRDAWDRMAVSAPPAAQVGAGALPAGLAAALSLIDEGFATGGPARPGGGRAVPSAGAIHPYECHVVTADAVYATDAVRRRAFRTGAVDPAALAAAGLRRPAGDRALVVIATRPWLSMRKYGDRGYLYTQLDTAHLAVNLLGLASRAPSGADLRLRLRREPLAALLGLGDRCREIHSVLRVGPDGRAAPAWTVYETGPAVDQPSWLERACWESLRPVPADHGDGGAQDAVPVGTSGAAAAGPPAAAPAAAPAAGVGRAASGGVLLAGSAGGIPLPAGGSLPQHGGTLLPEAWPALSAGRRSSKGFAAGAVPRAALGRALAAIGTELRCDLPGRTALRMTLVAREVDGLPAGVYRSGGLDGGASSGSEGGPGSGSAPAPSDADLVAACMHQDHLGAAAAAVLFHTGRDELLGRPPAALREALFRAGGLGQLLYLGATDAGLGVTGVGGFDTRRWRRMGCLPEGDELLYLVLLGADGGPGVKWDRQQGAYAQGER